MPIVIADKYVRIDGEKLYAIVAESMLGQESFARAVGMKRSGLQRVARPGVYDMRAENFRSVAEFLHISTDELRKRIAVKDGSELTRDHYVLRIPADVYNSLKLLAKSRTVAQYLADHVKGHRIKEHGADRPPPTQPPQKPRGRKGSRAHGSVA